MVELLREQKALMGTHAAGDCPRKTEPLVTKTLV